MEEVMLISKTQDCKPKPAGSIICFRQSDLASIYVFLGAYAPAHTHVLFVA